MAHHEVFVSDSLRLDDRVTAVVQRVEAAAAAPLRRKATPAERRKWLEEEALILTWASSGLGLGALLAGRPGGVVGCAVAGLYASIKITRRG